ncbi:MAG: glycosyltransferase family 39 protein [Eubacterium sp.]|nr:glycosyltransferase family 39 protein [Eubacterium sp.]MCM1305135.1 glycosyltransferase family 39 protein [Butyrivibrio sp.]MCM1344386.1 glycosyltransferase family 39 protein [Muribaculaceae bacterium]MCM1411728.1 glycosyltransferase family 39 protein [Lachnospiraceae bacterium]
MSWKKNAFSCLMWLLYMLMVGTALIVTGRALCDLLGAAACFGVAMPIGYLLATGSVVFLLHRMAAELDAGFRNMGRSLAWMERILILVLFAAGCFLRIVEMRSDSHMVSGGSVYLDLAYISEDGQGLFPVSRGAACLYIWMLRLCFFLMGNKEAAAVWLQIVLQMSGVALLYVGVRKLAGRISAVMTVSFFMLSPYMIQRSLELSPEMLYMLFFSLVLLFASRGVERTFGWGVWLIGGVMAAVLCYLDVAGFLLLPLMPGIIVMKRQDAGNKIFRGLSGCISGVLLGAAGCLLGTAQIGGKPVREIVRTWAGSYRWEDVRLAVPFPDHKALWPIVLLLCFMAWGIFSFWCEREVDRFTVWIFCLIVAVLMRCMGMFAEEMSGDVYLFFFGTVLAGLGIRESMAVHTRDTEEEIVERTDRKEMKDSTESSDITEEKALEAARQQEKPKIEFLENPLPLPKKHEKHIMDYKLDPGKDLGGYDVLVADDDDFDH